VPGSKSSFWWLKNLCPFHCITVPQNMPRKVWRWGGLIFWVLLQEYCISHHSHVPLPRDRQTNLKSKDVPIEEGKCVHMYIYIHPSIHLSIYPTFHPSIHPSIYASSKHLLRMSYVLPTVLRVGDTAVKETDKALISGNLHSSLLNQTFLTHWKSSSG